MLLQFWEVFVFVQGRLSQTIITFFCLIINYVYCFPPFTFLYYYYYYFFNYYYYY